MGGGEERANLLGGGGGGASASSANGNTRGKLTVHRGQLYYGDVGEGASSMPNDGLYTSTNPVPPPASSSGRRYQGGGVSFDNTLVDILESSSSSDGYDDCESYEGSRGDGGMMHVNAVGDGFNANGGHHDDGGGGGRGARGNGRGGGWGVSCGAAPLVLVTCALLAVTGLVATGTIDVMPGQGNQPWWQMEEDGGLEVAAIEGAVAELHGWGKGGDVRHVTGALHDRRDDRRDDAAASSGSLGKHASSGEGRARVGRSDGRNEKRKGARASKDSDAGAYQGAAARVAADAAGELGGNDLNNTTSAGAGATEEGGVRRVF